MNDPKKTAKQNDEDLNMPYFDGFENDDDDIVAIDDADVMDENDDIWNLNDLLLENIGGHVWFGAISVAFISFISTFVYIMAVKLYSINSFK